MEAKHVIQQHESHGQRLNDRIQMLEQLNHTLEEEKKTLLLQVNKLLEKNQELLVKTLESKDQAFEEERMFTLVHLNVHGKVIIWLGRMVSIEG